MKSTISVDFDSVLHDYSAGWTGYEPQGAPIPGALDFVNHLLGHDYEVVISSCRAYTDIGRRGIYAWLEQHGFPRIAVTHEKPHAVFYIDDRGIRFDGCFERAKEAMKQDVWFKQQREPRFEG